MAFKMKGSSYKMGKVQGTAAHKASIARVEEESIVAQTRTQGSAELMELGLELGKSLKPHAIDYTLKSPKIKLPKKKKKKKKKEKEEEEEKITKTTVEQEPITIKSQQPDLTEEMLTSIRQKKGEDIKVKTELTPGQYITLEEAKRGTGKGGEVQIDAELEAQLKEQMRVESERQVQVKAKIEAAKAEKEAKKTAKQKKKEGITQQNIEIRKRNQEKADAKKHFGPDVKLTQPKLDEYREMIKTEQEIGEIEEEDDPEYYEIQQQKAKADAQKLAELEKIAFQPQILSDKPTTQLRPSLSAGRQRLLDKKYSTAGPNVRANMIADGYKPEEQRESESVMQKRDDRIWRNAVKDGTVRSNMRKSGYAPRNER